MLKDLHISNYVLIDKLHLSPAGGMNVVTGETGAGKSIMLGAVGLLMGARADTKTLLNDDTKCVIEGLFCEYTNQVNELLFSQDIEVEAELIVRREIAPSGKSRAFVNDSPVKLNFLKHLSVLLLDVHSQHETLLLKKAQFQLKILDGFAETNGLLSSYSKQYTNFTQLNKKLNILESQQAQMTQDADYYNFLLNEFEELSLNPDTDSDLEEKLKKIEGTEEIKNSLSQVVQSLEDEQYGVVATLQQVLANSKYINEYKEYQDLYERLNSLLIESQDLSLELGNTNDNLIYDNEKAFEIKERVDAINKLLVKHQVIDVSLLLQKHEEIAEKVQQLGSVDKEIISLQKELKEVEKYLVQLSAQLSEERKKCIPDLQNRVVGLLQNLGMENAELEVKQDKTEGFTAFGCDDIQFLFSANKGSQLAPIHQVASGGEFSRLMFTLKLLAAEHQQMPTIIFDEIDTGISGDVALKMGEMMRKMAQSHQLIIITHLPQIAAKGQQHYYIYKDHSSAKTISLMKQLDKQERVQELAKMMSGDNASESALNIAKELLGFD